MRKVFFCYCLELNIVMKKMLSPYFLKNISLGSYSLCSIVLLQYKVSCMRKEIEK